MQPRIQVRRGANLKTVFRLCRVHTCPRHSGGGQPRVGHREIVRVNRQRYRHRRGECAPLAMEETLKELNAIGA